MPQNPARGVAAEGRGSLIRWLRMDFLRDRLIFPADLPRPDRDFGKTPPGQTGTTDAVPSHRHLARRSARGGQRGRNLPEWADPEPLMESLGSLQVISVTALRACVKTCAGTSR